MEKIDYCAEPTPLQCGQAVLAMVCKKTVGEIIELCGTDRETTLLQMRKTLLYCGFSLSPTRTPAEKKEDLPPLALLSLETPRCWHWSLFADGKFYDPAFGVLPDFPESARRYYWAITPL